MVIVSDFYSFNEGTKTVFFAEYNVNSIKSWVYVNIDDFYNWLKLSIPEYYKELRGRHFFFRNNTILEDYKSNDDVRRHKACNALNCYFDACYRNNGLPDLSKYIDLQRMSPLFREVHDCLVSHYSYNVFIEMGTGEYSKRFYKVYGSNWFYDVVNDGRRAGLRFDCVTSDGAGHHYISPLLRTGFYDSGSSREIQLDRQQGSRENSNSCGLK